MKSTKRFSFLLSLTMFSVSGLFCQDVGLPRMVYPVQNQRVHLQYSYTIDFIVKNYGTTSIPYKNISFDLLYDNQFWQTYNLSATSASLAAGDSIQASIGGITFATANETIKVCVASKLAGDNNKQNDTVCNELYFSLDKFLDLGPVLLKITNPATDTTVATGSQITKMEAWVHNFGNVTLPNTFSIFLQYKMYSKKKNYFGPITTILDTNENYIIELVGGHPDVQLDPGPFSVCVTINNAEDQNPDNDEFCRTFYAVDYTGISENLKASFRSFVSNDRLQVNFEDGHQQYSIEIFNSTGQRVHRELSGGPGMDYIDLTDLGPGVYILRIVDFNHEPVYTDKFVLD